MGCIILMPHPEGTSSRNAYCHGSRGNKLQDQSAICLVGAVLLSCHGFPITGWSHDFSSVLFGMKAPYTLFM